LDWGWYGNGWCPPISPYPELEERTLLESLAS
jgi:hypothetical protein